MCAIDNKEFWFEMYAYWYILDVNEKYLKKYFFLKPILKL